jgi:hypothetical protein
MATKTKIYLLLSVMVTGLFIVALPDTGPRLFSLSEIHGPSTVDAFGLMLVLIPYTMLVVRVWKRRLRLRAYKKSLAFKFGLFVFVVGLFLVVISVVRDVSHWWALGAILMAIVQIPIFYVALRS